MKSSNIGGQAVFEGIMMRERRSICGCCPKAESGDRGRRTRSIKA